MTHHICETHSVVGLVMPYTTLQRPIPLLSVSMSRNKNTKMIYCTFRWSAFCRVN